MNNSRTLEHAQKQYRIALFEILWALAESEGWGHRPERWPYPFSKQYRSIVNAKPLHLPYKK